MFFFLSHHTNLVRLHSHTYKETQKRKKKTEEGGWLPSTANKQRQKKKDQEPKERERE